MSVRITGLYRYPVKSLPGAPLESTEVAPGRGVPGDRRFALALPTAQFDGGIPHWLPKTSFATLMRYDQLGALQVTYDEGGTIIHLCLNEERTVRADLTTPDGRNAVKAFLKSHSVTPRNEELMLVDINTDRSFTDDPDPLLSIANLATIKDLERVIGRSIEPLRFRANIYIDGASPWQETEWIGHEIASGGAHLEVIDTIPRCAAVDVAPGSGKRDLSIVTTLARSFGHSDLGVYARVTRQGRLRVGDAFDPRGKSGQ